MPSFFDHGPVCFIAVHRDLHASAAAGDASVEAVIIQACHVIFDLIYIDQRAGFRHIAAVQQYMQTNFLYAVFLGTSDQRLQVIDVRVDIAIGQQAQEVHRSMILALVYQFLPGLCGKHISAFDGLVYQLCALAVDLAAAQCIVADLTVPHITVARQTDSDTMCLDLCMRAIVP